jgi:hypothetical protein
MVPEVIDPEQLCFAGYADATTAHNRRRMTKKDISFTIGMLAFVDKRCKVQGSSFKVLVDLC